MTAEFADRPRIVVRSPAGREAERTYILDLVLGEWLGFEIVEDPVPAGPGWTILRLVDDAAAREVALPDVLFGVPDEDWLTERAAPFRPLRRVDLPFAEPSRGSLDGADLPVVFGVGTGKSPWTVNGTRVSLSIDVLGSAFWLLARCEEVVTRTRDAHGRFSLDESLAAREGFVGRPLVDELVDLMGAAMRVCWPELPVRSAGRPFRLRLTHDIDTPFAAWNRPRGVVARATLGDLVRRHDPGLAARRARAALDARSGRVDRDPLGTFDALMDVSERHGLRSQFYFLTGTDPSGVDARYRIADAPFAPVLRHIHERGHDIGLHAGYGTFQRPDVMEGELRGLKAACRAAGVDRETWGVRQHFLRWAWPGTAQIHETLGMDHDSSIGFAEEIGFRAGTSREYPLFDPVARRRLALRERPLVVMDTTLFEYMALKPEAAAERTRTLVQRCRQHGGEAVLLVHNDRVAGRRSMAWYRELVADLLRP